ncbi:hypothetical protein M378DRAFT_125196 [Amanita muscaria Koide BX008]|uniref:Uncharacterized protein n=1 Tax=Amanita muscaria (strain Koide BX008) TaxID=946122 RepID=A0A0C2SR27_AMAMK|nr:hypothetical protein M378DRAFT_125196 [Amanita muscaria Koide BX008]
MADIVVIGAGCGGLAFAIALQRKYGYKNYVIYEKAGDLGGTWRANTYPGCSSDVGMSFFSLSTDIRNWSASHAFQPEILAYWRSLAHKYSLLPHIKYNHSVVSAEWDETSQRYHVTVHNEVTGETSVTDAKVIVSAIGILNVPRWPEDISGLRTFGGSMFHSARWDSEVDLRGKNVAVIGNGPSAVQLVPPISSDPSVSVTNFVRTSSWFLPHMYKKYSPLLVWLRGIIPGALRMQRIGTFLIHEMSYYLVFTNSVTRRFMQWLVTRYMRSKTPPKYYQSLIPKHDLGCKRALFDADYLDSLHRPNVSVCLDGIQEIVRDGIVTRNGDKLPFDVIILATGFVADDYPIPIQGKNNITVDDYYRLSGGPTAYLGTSTPGFPNFYTLFGPNITTGFTSVLYSHELQIEYILQLIKPVLDGKASSFDVTSDATNEYNAKIQKRLSNSVFMQCTSWYRSGNDGKVSNIFPGSGMLMWWWLRKPVWDHYQVSTDGKRWKEEREAAQKSRQYVLVSAVAAAVIAILATYTNLFGQVLDSLQSVV